MTARSHSRTRAKAKRRARELRFKAMRKVEHRKARRPRRHRADDGGMAADVLVFCFGFLAAVAVAVVVAHHLGVGS